MKKQLIQRGLLGFPLGIALGYIITILISAIWAKGYYSAATPQFIEMMGNEINAVILQAVFCGIMGSGFAMASVIWEMDSWSLVKQSGIYFAIACVIMFPIAYVTNWMQHSIRGILLYIAIFIVIFIAAWLFQYVSWKRKIQKMNDCVKNAKDQT